MINAVRGGSDFINAVRYAEALRTTSEGKRFIITIKNNYSECVNARKVGYAEEIINFVTGQQEQEEQDYM